MRLDCALVLHEQQVTECCLYLQRKLCFHLSDIKSVQHFQKGLVHEFYGFKASQMNKVHASSHELIHMLQKIRNLCGQNFEGEATRNWIVRILNKATSVIKYLSLTLV